MPTDTLSFKVGLVALHRTLPELNLGEELHENRVVNLVEAEVCIAPVGKRSRSEAGDVKDEGRASDGWMRGITMKNYCKGHNIFEEYQRSRQRLKMKVENRMTLRLGIQ